MSKIDQRLLREIGGDLEELKLRYKTSAFLRNLLKNVLTKDLESLIIKAEAEEVCANTALQQHMLGQRNALRSVIKLLEDIE